MISGPIAFLLVPFLLRHLGAELYGVWVLIGSVFAYSSILHFGLSSAINRYIPVGLARGDDQEIRRVASTGTGYFAMVAAIVAVLAVVLYFNFTRWFNIPSESAMAARRAILVVGLLLSVTVSCQTFSAILSGYQRYDLTAGSRIAMVLVRAVAVIGVMVAGGGLLSLALVYGLTELGINVIQLVLARQLMPARTIGFSSFDPALLKEMLGYGINTFLYSTGAVIAFEASELIIAVFLRPEDVARYSVAATGALVGTALIESLSAALKPAVSDLDARDEAHSIRALSLLSQKYTLLLIVPSTVFLVIMGPEFLEVWTGSIDPEMTMVLALLAAAQAFRLAQHSNFLVLVGKGEHRFFGLAVLLVGLLTVGLGILGVGVLHLGLVGAALASFVAWGTVCGVVVPMHVGGRLKISRRQRWLEVTKPVSIACLPCLLMVLVWKYVHPPSTWPEILFIVGAGVVVTGGASWQFGLDEGERLRFLRFFRPWIPRFLG